MAKDKSNQDAKVPPIVLLNDKELVNNRETADQDPVSTSNAPVASDEQLKILITQNSNYQKTYQADTEWVETVQTICDLGIDEVFEEFFSNNAPFGFEKLGSLQKHFDFIVNQPWKKNVMIINVNIPVVGVPFIRETRAVKTVTIQVRSATELIVEMDTVTIDAPYSDTFSCKMAWIVVSANENEQRSIIKVLHKVNFVKSTMFKSKIKARASEGMIETASLWLNHA